jgi:hypothetical protein
VSQSDADCVLGKNAVDFFGVMQGHDEVDDDDDDDEDFSVEEVMAQLMALTKVLFLPQQHC